MADAARDVSQQKGVFRDASVQTLLTGMKAQTSKEAVEANEELCRAQEEILRGGLSETSCEKKDFILRQSDKAADNLITEIKKLSRASEDLKDYSKEIHGNAEKAHKKMKDIGKENAN